MCSATAFEDTLERVSSCSTRKLSTSPILSPLLPPLPPLPPLHPLHPLPPLVALRCSSISPSSPFPSSSPSTSLAHLAGYILHLPPLLRHPSIDYRPSLDVVGAHHRPHRMHLPRPQGGRPHIQEVHETCTRLHRRSLPAPPRPSRGAQGRREEGAGTVAG